MWANVQALASGLREWGALALWAGAAEGMLSLGAERLGSAGGRWGWGSRGLETTGCEW